jgi:hypothetical protein
VASRLSGEGRRFLAVAAALFVLNALRLPGTFLYPSFWAEDGTIFFADSIELGTPALWKPVVGMYLVVSRTAAFLASFAPVRHIPLVYAILAGLVSSACLAVFCRDGFRWLVPSDRMRILLCLLFSLAPGAAECFFAVVPLTYLLFVATLLLLLERDASGAWRMGGKRAALVSFLFFSVGQAAVLAPLLLYLLVRTRNRWYGFCLALLTLSAGLNLASGNPHGPASRPSLAALTAVFGDNVLVRLFYLPLLGRPGMDFVLPLSAWAFLALSVLAIVPIALLVRRTTRLDAEGGRALALAVACGMSVFPVTAITRDYALGVLRRSNLIFGTRYDVFPTVVALILAGALLAPLFVGWRRFVAAGLFAAVAVHVLREPFYRAPDAFRPFVWEWPGQAERIESALALRRQGTLEQPVVVQQIGCRPGSAWGSLRVLVISP